MKNITLILMAVALLAGCASSGPVATGYTSKGKLIETKRFGKELSRKSVSFSTYSNGSVKLNFYEHYSEDVQKIYQRKVRYESKRLSRSTAKSLFIAGTGVLLYTMSGDPMIGAIAFGLSTPLLFSGIKYSTDSTYIVDHSNPIVKNDVDETQKSYYLKYSDFDYYINGWKFSAKTDEDGNYTPDIVNMLARSGMSDKEFKSKDTIAYRAVYDSTYGKTTDYGKIKKSSLPNAKMVETQLAVEYINQRDRDLSKSARRDKYLVAATNYLKINNYKDALLYMKLLEKMKAKLPVTMNYFRGEAEYHAGTRADSKRYLNKYIQSAGSQGRYYKDSLELLLKMDS